MSQSGGKLARPDSYHHIRAVVRADWDKSKVAIVSGRGSGDEPAHAGFVGQGMPTAAVCGYVFAFPSVDAVLAGILAVTGPSGCLLVVRNYTGDRLNFGHAVERARAFGLKANMLIVDDDVALPDLLQSRGGVSVILLVHEIAGALDDVGNGLEVITAAAEWVIASTSSIGMSLDTCTVPDSPKKQRIPVGMAELGLGIHGGAAGERISFQNAAQAMESIAEKLAPSMSDQPHVALLNSLGGATVLEMTVLASELAC